MPVRRSLLLARRWPPAAAAGPIVVTGLPGRRSSARWASRSAPAPPAKTRSRAGSTRPTATATAILTADEMQADAERFFAELDTDHDGEIDPDELVHYEWEVAPEIQVNVEAEAPAPATRRQGEIARDRDRRGCRRGGATAGDGYRWTGLQGAARYALLNMPEPVAAADADFNRAITLDEFRQAALDRFQLLDKEHAGQAHACGPRSAVSRALDGRQRPASAETRSRDTRVGNPLPPGD